MMMMMMVMLVVMMRRRIYTDDDKNEDVVDDDDVVVLREAAGENWTWGKGGIIPSSTPRRCWGIKPCEGARASIGVAGHQSGL